jgi:ribosome-binding protein aMBF1 (putative translation factor)
MKTAFDRYLKQELKKPAVRRAFEEERAMLNIGLALAKERQKKGLSQREIARRIGTSAPQISRTERSPEHSNVQTLQRYAKALGMKLDMKLVSSR